MGARWLGTLRDFFVSLDEVIDRRPEDDLRDDLDGLRRRVEALESGKTPTERTA